MLIIISDEASNMEYYLSSSKKFKGKYYTLMGSFHRNSPNITPLNSMDKFTLMHICVLENQGHCCQTTQVDY